MEDDIKLVSDIEKEHEDLSLESFDELLSSRKKF